MDNKATPFECDNCGRKFDAAEVLERDAVCPKCHDTILAYSIDTAVVIKDLSSKLEQAKKLLNETIEAEVDLQLYAEDNKRVLEATEKAFKDVCDERDSLARRLQACSKLLDDLDHHEECCAFDESGDVDEDRGCDCLISDFRKAIAVERQK